MTKTFNPNDSAIRIPSLLSLLKPFFSILKKMSPLEAKGNRPLQMTFEDQLKALILFHLEEHDSGRHLIDVLEKDVFAKKEIAPGKGIKKSAFFEALNTRGLEQLLFVFNELYAQASKVLPKEHGDLGDLVSIDDSLIDAVLSMHWADYRKGANKAKAYMGFDLNHCIPRKIYLTDGIEIFFGWWKKHLRVYHLIARSEYGLMVQILAGLITYLLFAIYCNDYHNEKVSIQRVRDLRIKIKNESIMLSGDNSLNLYQNALDDYFNRLQPFAKT